MFAWESRRPGRSGHDRRRPTRTAWVESLESRELLAYNPLGFSLPDLTVNGYASPAASWGGPISVTVNVANIGASTTLEPLALAPGSTSSADALPTTVAVYAVTNRHSLQGAVEIGTISVPALAQNAVTQISQTLTLPQRPTGFPGDGGTIYLVYVANANLTAYESNPTNNVSPPVPVRIEAPLPEIVALGLDVPPVMQPGDTIQPNIRLANFGPADTSTQGPVTLALVASTTPNFNVGSSVIATYSVPNIPGVSAISSQGAVYSDANLTPGKNIITIAGSPVTLPKSPAVYYIGVVVDPFGQIKQLGKVPEFRTPSNPFQLSRQVGPPIPGLLPAGVGTAGGLANVPLFPYPFGGHAIGGLPNNTGTFPSPFPPTNLSNTSSSTVTAAANTISASETVYNVASVGGQTGVLQHFDRAAARHSNHLGLAHAAARQAFRNALIARRHRR